MMTKTKTRRSPSSPKKSGGGGAGGDNFQIAIQQLK